jgi:hypothetical protein
MLAGAAWLRQRPDAPTDSAREATMSRPKNGPRRDLRHGWGAWIALCAFWLTYAGRERALVELGL